MKITTLKARLTLIIIANILNFSLFAFFGITSLEKIDEDYYDIIEVTNTLLTDSSELSEVFGELRRNIVMVIYSRNNSASVVSEIEGNFLNFEAIATKFVDNLNTVNNSGYNMNELIGSVEDIKNLKREYFSEFNNMITAITTDNQAMFASAENAIIVTGSDLHSRISNVSLDTFESLTFEVNEIKDTKNATTIFLLVVFIISAFLSAFLLTIMSKSIRNPIDKLKDASLQVADGNMNVQVVINKDDEIGDLSQAVDTMVVNFKDILIDINNLSNNLKEGKLSDYKINEQKYTGSYKEVVSAVNQTVSDLLDDNLYIINVVKAFGKGDFESEVQSLPGEKIAMTEAILSVQDILKAFVDAVNKLSHDVGNGEFKNLLDASPYEGEWVGITNGLNRLVQVIDEAMIDTQKSFTAFSQGNFDYRITKNYKGYFAEVVATTNYTAEIVGSYISEISEILNEMSNQNFNVEMTLDYVGDFILIQESVENIVTNLNILTKNIIISAEQVSDGARQISDTSMALAEGATAQATSVEKLTAVTEIISKQADLSVENSKQANQLVSETKQSANTGNNQMEEMLKAMSEINESSNSISNIIKVIDDIAFQTNILALNAAVEAARAGEHGKGFAVVAEEVRSLAGRSQQAAKETTVLIENSVVKVGEGSIIANNTSKALSSIVEQIDSISSIIQDNQSSSIEQQKSIVEITKNINEISKVTQVNTSTSEESASASEELSSQASVFYNSVSEIKLKK